MEVSTTMRIWDTRYTRDLRRYRLAVRLISHEVRTRTITRWTGIAPTRIRALYREYFAVSGVRRIQRHRGASPYVVSYCFRNPRIEAEATALAAMCLRNGLLRKGAPGDSVDELATVERGEILCETFELYRALLPRPDRSSITLEHLILLVQELASAQQICLARCRHCPGLLICEVGTPSPVCVYCRRGRGQSAPSDIRASGEVVDAQAVLSESDSPFEEERQQSLF